MLRWAPLTPPPPPPHHHHTTTPPPPSPPPLALRYISSAAKPPPLFVVGVEGVWGMLISLLVIYPVASFIPGDDNGCYETLSGATDILFNSKSIMVVTAIYFTCVFTFNAIGIFITKILDALWKALVSVMHDLARVCMRVPRRRFINLLINLLINSCGMYIRVS